MSESFNQLNDMGNAVLAKLEEKKPEILLCTSIVCGITAVGATVVATAKSAPILQEIDVYGQELDELQKMYEESDAKTAKVAERIEMAKSMQRERIIDGAKKMAKYAAIPVVLTGLAIGTEIGCYKTLDGRVKKLAAENATITAAFQALNVFTTKYRKRVIDKLGKDADEEFATGMKKVDIEEEVVDSKGKKKIVKKTITTLPGDPGMYARLLSQSPRFEKDSDWNADTIINIQALMNQRLRAKGFLFLNEVYKEFGWPEVSYGWKLGWIYDPDDPNCAGDNIVEFRCKSIKTFDPNTGKYFDDFLINFNFDGLIDEKAFEKERGIVKGLMTPDNEIGSRPKDRPPFWEIRKRALS